jgi:aspartate 1-decarboxylase
MANSNAIVQEFVVRTLLAAKLHGGSVTEANLEYEGSITIDPQLMSEVGIFPYEQVDVFDITNGARFTTYTIEGSLNSGEICVNGAAAHLVAEGDRIIVVAYVSLSVEDAKVHTPKIVYLDAENRITRRASVEGHRKQAIVLN